MKNNIRNLLVLLLTSCVFSANAQKRNHTEIDLDSNDIFGGLLESSQNLSIKLYQLVMDNKVKIYKDSLFKKEIKGKEKTKHTISIELICGGRPYATSHFDLKDHWDTVYYNPKSCFKIYVESNYIKFNTRYQPYHFDVHYFMPLDKTLALLNDDDKTILGIWIKSLNGIVNEKTIRNYTQNYFKNKLTFTYTMTLEGNLLPYNNAKLEMAYSAEELTELGLFRENFFEIPRPGSDDPYDLIDSIAVTPVNSEILKGFKIIYHQNSDSNFHQQFQILALGILYKHTKDTSKGYKNLYYLKPDDFFKQFSNEEKLMWDAMVQYHIFRKFEDD